LVPQESPTAHETAAGGNTVFQAVKMTALCSHDFLGKYERNEKENQKNHKQNFRDPGSRAGDPRELQ
jgi:hypothetical protein